MVRFSLLALMVLLAGCGGTIGGSSSSFQSHGPSIPGYGPIPFGTPRQMAYQMLQGRGQFEHMPGSDESVLTYMDYIDYLLVRVEQHFDGQDMASKAEVFVVDPQNAPKTLNECRGLNFSVYGMLQGRYGQPDWEPRVASRSYGEAGILMYTFADGSNIMLHYDYAGQDQQVGLCTVKLAFNPIWAGSDEE